MTPITLIHHTKLMLRGNRILVEITARPDEQAYQLEMVNRSLQGMVALAYPHQWPVDAEIR